MFRLINYESVLCSWLSLALKSPRTTSKNGFSSETKTRVISKLSEKLQNCLETDYVTVKCNKTTKFVSYYQRNAMHSSKRRTPVTFKGSF